MNIVEKYSNLNHTVYRLNKFISSKWHKCNDNDAKKHKKDRS